VEEDRLRMLEAVLDIEQRRLQAFIDGSGKGLSTVEHLALQPEATTQEDIDTLQDARAMLDDFSRAVLDVYVDVWQDFGKYRCSVCGRTLKQSKAIGYNCTSEC